MHPVKSSPFLLVFLLACHASAIQESERLRERVERAWRSGEGGAELEFFKVAWETRHHDIPSNEELERLRRRVHARPEHPERERLEAIERRLAQGPDLERLDVWFGEAGTIRRNLTTPDGAFNDLVVTPGLSWSYASRGAQMNLIDKPGLGYPAGYNYGPWERRLRREMSGFLEGGFSIRAPGDLQLSHLELESTAWTAVFAAEGEGLALRIEGAWDHESDTIRATRVTVIESVPSPEETGRSWVFSDWVPIDGLERTVCTVQTEYAPDGRVLSVRRLRSMTPIDRAEIASVTAPVDPAGPIDAVRGTLRISAVQRFPGGDRPAVLTMYDESGHAVGTLNEADYPANKARRALRRLGVLSAIGVVTTVIGLALWKKHRAG